MHWMGPRLTGSVVYGHGHHDSGLDERLFTLNRERDAKRAGKEALRVDGGVSLVGRTLALSIRRLVGLVWPLGRLSRRPGGVLSDSNPKKSQVISS